MPFLVLNGWPIEVREIKESAEYLGGIKRVFRGSARNFSQAIKRKWEITTTPLPLETAEALKLFVAGVGDHVGLKNITRWSNTLTDFATDKGVVPCQGSGVISVGDLEGFNVIMGNTPSTTNLLSQNQASFETDLSGWTVSILNNLLYIERTTDDAFHGSASLMVKYKTSGDTAWSIVASDIPVSAGTTYTFSWYMKNNMDLSSVSGDSFIPAIIWKDSSKNVISSSTLTNLGPANMNWHRVYITTTAPSGAAYADLRIGFDSPNFSSTGILYIDGIQFEASSYPTPFAYTTQSYALFHYNSLEILSKNDFTILARARMRTQPPHGYCVVALYTGFSNQNTLCIGSSSNYNPYFMYVKQDYSHIYYVYSATTIPTQTWFTIAMTGNLTRLAYYYNDTQLSTTSNPGYRLLRPDSDILLGTAYYDIADVYLLPYALPPEAVAGIHSCPYTSSFPELIAYGDFLPSPYVTVLGEIQDFDYIQYYRNGNWTTGQIVKFSLYEV